MFMNGELLHSISDLRRCFSIDELIYNYYSGELEIWLKEIGEAEKARQISKIEKNALLLIRLYQIFDLKYELSEEEIRKI